MGVFFYSFLVFLILFVLYDLFVFDCDKDLTHSLGAN
jgi:hypothetical protein